MSDRVEQLLDQLTLDEKASLTAGVDMWHGHAVERLDVPALKVSDGPVGVRGDAWVGTTSACTPCGTALGATWDPDLLEQVGALIGEEARTKAVDIVLAPTVNLHRNPLAGRNFECYSEDPHLSAVAAVAVIRGIQSTGVGACVKHLVANDSEFERHTISSEVTERVLRELYLAPFEAAVRDADVVSVMSAYNRLNGTYCAQHRWLLPVVRRDEWGFDGIVISDWWGTKGDESLDAGLDLEMPGPPIHSGPRAAQRVRAGELEASVLDDTVRRLLTTMERLGVLDLIERPTERSVDRPEHRELLRRAARDSIVLLRNDAVDGAPALPLDRTALRRLAVIGPNADIPAALGGGSASLNPHHVVTVLDGLRAALGDDVEIAHEIGVASARTAPPLDRRRVRPAIDGQGEHGLSIEYFANRSLEGDPVATSNVTTPRLVWLGSQPAPDVATNDFSFRMRGTFTADVVGEHTFAMVTGGAGGRVLLDGDVVIDNLAERRPGTMFFGLGSEEERATLTLDAGQEVEVVAEFVSFEDLPVAAFLLGHLPPVGEDGIARAVEAAATSDAAIVVVGLDQDSESEGEDRLTLDLPGRQAALVRAVVDANPRTVVLVNAGSVVDLDCAHGAAALAQTWYLGQETGHAVADVLLGDHSPSGRLPMTYGERLEDWPSWLNYPGEADRVLYGEELFMGYRGFDERGTEPRWCFGHGLTYTTFEWGATTADRDELAIAGPDPQRHVTAVRVDVEVRNAGGVAAAEVVQCYVHDGTGQRRRPDQELVAFAKVHLEPGEATTVTLELDERAFAAWDAAASCWSVDAGTYEVRVGPSSRDVRGEVVLDVTDRS
ncbi:MAG: beta-glucosidase H [Microthrixaceae bacterium]